MEMEDQESYGPSWKVVASALSVVMLALVGYYLGDTITSLRADIKEIRLILNANVAVAARLDTLQRETDDQEVRLREIEKQLWSQHRSP